MSDRASSTTSPAPTATQVLWRDVTGGQLEELLYGLLDAMGASALTWRAGAEAGVTASDGGRDLEATFDRPAPDGELDRQRWWVESKGRSGTVERGAVQSAVIEASGQANLDYLVVATNSRFSNPTRDWVREWSRSHARPIVKLWDRDHLERSVRRYPTVAARVLPSVLSDIERVSLLVDRFESLGEESTESDLAYFWDRRDWLSGIGSASLAPAVVMFMYAEGPALPRIRSWWRCCQVSEVPNLLVDVLINLPARLSDSLARPLEMSRAAATAGRLVLAAQLLLHDDVAAARLTLNPWSLVVDDEEVDDDAERLSRWQRDVLDGVLAYARTDLLDACSSDCERVTGDNPLETESLIASHYWRLLFEGNVGVDAVSLVGEDLDGVCTVGCDMLYGCPLIASNHLPPEAALAGIRAVLKFREERPDGAAPRRGRPSAGRRNRLTFFDGPSLSYRVVELGGRPATT